MRVEGIAEGISCGFRSIRKRVDGALNPVIFTELLMQAGIWGNIYRSFSYPPGRLVPLISVTVSCGPKRKTF